ncbi:MAG: hypothetical protein VSS75_031265 [Candidatus Parabeggiatoa sp.]|nr:hypothetical protein [Candidatus Parabeggiatoa sp.]
MKKQLTPQMVRGALMQRGLTLSEWARQNGYSQQHVSSIVHRWTGRTSGHPKMGAYRIVKAISQTIGQPITPVVPYL